LTHLQSILLFKDSSEDPKISPGGKLAKQWDLDKSPPTKRAHSRAAILVPSGLAFGTDTDFVRYSGLYTGLEGGVPPVGG
jgi:hypothetical protein